MANTFIIGSVVPKSSGTVTFNRAAARSFMAVL
jgi:hypothetical protein